MEMKNKAKDLIRTCQQNARGSKGKIEEKIIRSDDDRQGKDWCTRLQNSDIEQNSIKNRIYKSWNLKSRK